MVQHHHDHRGGVLYDVPPHTSAPLVMARRTDTDPDLMTVEEFAIRYSVETRTVRWWIKQGYIKYELVGPRNMRRIRASSIVSKVEGNANVQKPGEAAGVERQVPAGQGSTSEGAVGTEGTGTGADPVSA